MADSAGMHDVIVIGGGPAGSTTASYLAMAGFDVALFERERFPREHVGESLLPFCHGLFEELGVLDQMKQHFVRKPGVRFVTADGKHFTTWCFDRVIDDESYLSFQVARAEFDQLLLRNSSRLGVSVHEETKVVDAEFVDPGDESHGVTVTVEAADGSTRDYRARFLLDASGRSTFMGTRMRERKANPDLDRTALWTHYGNVELKGGLEEGISVIVYLGGDKKGWAWVFPLGVDRVTVGFVTDNAYIRTRKKELEDQHGADWKLALMEGEVHSSPFIHRILEGAERTKPLYVNGDYSYTVETKYGPDFALVGDAGRFIDPIFSSGVFLSMKSGRIVAGAIEAMLGGDNPRDPAPLEAAYKTINGAYNFVHRMIKLFYTPHALSWAEAGGAVKDVDSAIEHGDAMAAGHYMLAGDFFEKQEKYNSMFEVLENPTNFSRYKKLVIDRETFQEGSCRVDRNEIFPELAAAAGAD